MAIPAYSEDVPCLTTLQMTEVDRAMIEDYQMQLIQMMENAGRHLAHLARIRFFEGNPAGKTVMILAGSGGNGGGALACARRLYNWGATVHVFLAKPAEAFSGVPARQLRILQQLNLSINGPEAFVAEIDGDLIIDGLIGYNLQGAPRGAMADAIQWANKHPAPTLALDVPSGINASTGQVFQPAIKAAATLTLALPKTGFQKDQSKPHLGELYLADISVPPELYARSPLNLEVGAIFSQSDLVRLW